MTRLSPKLFFFFAFCAPAAYAGNIEIEHSGKSAAFFINDSIKRENVKGKDVVPLIKFPGISQSDFQEAFNVLDECLVMNEPRYGFSYPFIAPGGHYGGCWWQLDASISLSGTKWVNQRFSENMLRGFAAVQKPDGRIPLYGHDKVPNFPVCSSLPKLFTAAYAVLKQSDDKKLLADTYLVLQKYMDWWFSPVRRDEKTGLITGVFEESFPPFEDKLKTNAQIDLNVEIVAGCEVLSKLAQQLGKTEDSEKYAVWKKQISEGINKYMWNEAEGAYYSYLTAENKLDDKLIAYTFDPFRRGIAPANRRDEMIKMLTDDRYFNWDHNAITSAAKTDKIYTETAGDYDGNPAWSGDIWTLRNQALIEGLQDIGRYDLAAAMSIKTVKLFNNNYTEFLKTSDGSGQGVKRYAWTAAQYVQILIENIFGVDYNGFTNTITIRPNLDKSLTGEKIGLENLLLPNGNRLTLNLLKSADMTEVTYDLTGISNDMNMVISLPANSKMTVSAVNKQGRKQKITLVKSDDAVLHELHNGKKHSDTVQFNYKK